MQRSKYSFVSKFIVFLETSTSSIFGTLSIPKSIIISLLINKDELLIPKSKPIINAKELYSKENLLLKIGVLISLS